MQDDPVGLLNALTGWVQRRGSGSPGTAVVKTIDNNFTITAPYDLPAG
ncbi:hypothetical protein ACL02O_20610 [Micromonospora sp. MS34]